MPKLFGRNFTRRQLLERVGDISQLMHARRAELSEGFERGADLIEVFNASGFGFSVLPGRALDIASAHYKGQSLCFRSGPGDVGPAFYEAEGFAWGRGWFGGCGLGRYFASAATAGQQQPEAPQQSDGSAHDVLLHSRDGNRSRLGRTHDGVKSPVRVPAGQPRVS